MTVDELVTLIMLRHKLKREISEEEIQSIKQLSTDPKHCYIDILNNEMPVKRYTSHIRFSDDDVEYYCARFINNLKKKGYIIKSFRYLDNSGNVVPGAWSFYARRFSVAFTNPK